MFNKKINNNIADPDNQLVIDEDAEIPQEQDTRHINILLELEKTKNQLNQYEYQQ
ncbi:7678_t:CDS:2 [Entrophospora sp. SA101]|nr:7678_t:CDS:2 [Entrophospora sp. SA101]